MAQAQDRLTVNVDTQLRTRLEALDRLREQIDEGVRYAESPDAEWASQEDMEAWARSLPRGA